MPDIIRYTGKGCPFWFSCRDYQKECSMYDCPRPPNEFIVKYWRMLREGKQGGKDETATAR